MNIYDEYKKNRVYDDSFMGGPFFKKMAYNEDLFKLAGVHHIFKHKTLEADDCATLTQKYFNSKIL